MVIVGSGAGGASAARVLSEAGLSVIVVEDGDYHDASTYTTDPFDSLPKLYRDSGLTACEGRPAIPLPVGRCVGGTTVINSGTCFRGPDDVLARWRARVRHRLGGDLDREFEEVERALDVTPVQQGRVGRNAELCRLGAEALGVSNHGRWRATPATWSAAGPAPPAARSTPSARCTCPSCRARWPPAAAYARARGRRRSSSSTGAPPACAAAAATRCGRGRSCSPGERSARPSCCCRRGSPTRRAASGATCASTPPAGWARCSTSRCAAGTASCRAGPWTSGTTEACSSRPPSPRSRSARTGCAAPARPIWSGSPASTTSP